MKLIKPYLILTVLVWLPWGLWCVFNVQQIETIIGVTSTSADGTSDIRAMYGGVQAAVGLMAAWVLFNRAYVQHALFAFAFLGICMALARTYGLLIDGSWTAYTISVSGYEAFTGLSALGLLRGMRQRPSD